MLFTENDAACSLFDIDALGGVAPRRENVASPLAWITDNVLVSVASPLARLTDNASVSIDVVALRRAQLVLRWATIRGYTILVFNQATQIYSA